MLSEIAGLARLYPLPTFFGLAYGFTWWPPSPTPSGSFRSRCSRAPVPRGARGHPARRRAARHRDPAAAAGAVARRAAVVRTGAARPLRRHRRRRRRDRGARRAAGRAGRPRGPPPALVPIFVFNLLFPLSGALGEEPGRRGFALPRLLAGPVAPGSHPDPGGPGGRLARPPVPTGQYCQVPLRSCSSSPPPSSTRCCSPARAAASCWRCCSTPPGTRRRSSPSPRSRAPTWTVLRPVPPGGQRGGAAGGLLAGAGFARTPAPRGAPALSPGAA